MDYALDNITVHLERNCKLVPANIAAMEPVQTPYLGYNRA